MSYSRMFSAPPVYTPAEIKEILFRRFCGESDLTILKAIHAGRESGLPGYGIAEPELNYNSAGIRKVAGAPPRTKADFARVESALNKFEKSEARELREIEKGIAALEKKEQKAAEKAAKKTAEKRAALTGAEREKEIARLKAEIAALMGTAETVDVSGAVWTATAE